VFSRLLPTAIFRAHWKALSDYRRVPPRPDWGSRIAVVGLPLVTTAAMVRFHGELRSPEAYLAALAIFAGGLLAAFTHLSGVRDRLEQRAGAWGDAEKIDRDAIDESAAHLLVASYMAGVAAALLVLGLNVAPAPIPPATEVVVGGWIGALATGAMTHVLILFLVAIPRLYSAYTTAFTVSDALNGYHRGR
jgi:hypothetical protein